MKRSEFENPKKPTFPDVLEKALPIAMRELELDTLPKIKLLKKVKDTQQPTFGRYENGVHVVYLAIDERNPNDILRSLIHELVHYKQDLDNRLDDYSGETGSDEENEAHARAGMIMRHINKAYPELLSAESIKLP